MASALHARQPVQRLPRTPTACGSYYTDVSRKSTIDGSDISGGRVQVINLWQTYSNGVGSGEKQSQLYMAPVPEPATLALWGIGLGIVGFVKLVRRKK